MSARVIVVGGGFAGLAAALSARARGVEVALVRGRAGASALSCGAFDLAGWDAASGDRGEVGAEVRELLVAAKAPVVLEDARVVASSGVIRGSRGSDVQVLRLGAANAIIGVPRVPVGAWDASAIAASLDEQLRPSSGGASAITATLLRHRREERMPLADLAILHDAEARIDWLIERLKEAIAAAETKLDALLLPPMLGVGPSAIERLRRALPIAIGEALGEPGGAAAVRYARWSERALIAAGITFLEGEVTHVSSAGVQLRDADGATRASPADRVVLAMGGVASGGLLFGTGEHEPSGAVPLAALAPIRLSITVGRPATQAPTVAWCNGAPILAASSLFGLDADRVLLGADPMLLRAGLAIDERGNVLDLARQPIAWLFAAGDVTADRPRTALDAMLCGARAGRAAAGAVAAA